MKRLAILTTLAAIVTCAVCAVLIVRQENDNHRTLARTQAVTAQTEELARLTACLSRSQALTAFATEANNVTPAPIGLSVADSTLVQRNLQISNEDLVICNDLRGSTSVPPIPTTTPTTSPVRTATPLPCVTKPGGCLPPITTAP